MDRILSYDRNKTRNEQNYELLKTVEMMSRNCDDILLKITHFMKQKHVVYKL